MLLRPLKVRGLELKNRMVVSPMCTYSANDGIASAFHAIHLGRFALGGFALVFTEATAIHPMGRITHGDLGIWSDAHIEPLKRVTEAIRWNGAIPGIQLAHAGRKASTQRPWRGNGPLTAEDVALGDIPWEVVGPTTEPMDEGWLQPKALTVGEIGEIVTAWRDAALRALQAGYEVVEIHAAHGYLLHQFLSPLSNSREDEYGGCLEGRMRFPLDVARAVRSVWPTDRPVFCRISATDNVVGGWTVEDSVEFARELKALGIDVIDCSSGGLTGANTAARIKRERGFQVFLANQIRAEAAVATMAVGLILTAAQANGILEQGSADLVAIGREALNDPNWAVHAYLELAKSYERWPEQFGWWLERRASILASSSPKAS
ncbi:NADH:flavin oxidoreductase/NADH oxidase [Variovorax sp. J31P179]|uniref:NADH:flavin oxidoreductase/NADH oxidase n=1 Tax=Variovorax sp. J31P179 TaxID=3053508 RepID=UPI002578E0F6|nr:NADH:flavin oxidoreductase/NADH oxidase [Variovorax sp. J31P179]MDM0084730.1 NADH:flavin oxidoreductase/NADH oxidase [Variovorax sp. J31P179]